MRIVGGALRGRPLASPKGTHTRPTTDRVREALFNILTHAPWAKESPADGAQVIDACCGSGALGLEALSRGAAFCTFIDNDRDALALARQNARSLGVTNRCQFTDADITSPPRLREPANLILIDAPYKTNLGPDGLKALAEAGALAPSAITVLELPAAKTPVAIEGFETLDDRRYGDTRLVFVRG